MEDRTHVQPRNSAKMSLDFSRKSRLKSEVQNSSKNLIFNVKIIGWKRVSMKSCN